MTHRFPIKEIARQAGLSTATIDRALNNRDHVSPQTRARVGAALSELEAQEQQLSAKGRRLFVDVIVEAPRRFSHEIKSACEAVLPELTHAVFRPRFFLQETMGDNDLRSALARIKNRGSHGVILKARDVSAARDMVDMLENAGIPVITMVTDIRKSQRCAYVGMDNAKAGRTAAYLLASILNQPGGTVLASRSQEDFQGESERFEHFEDQFSILCPDYKIIVVTGGGGLAVNTRVQLRRALTNVSKIDAVYSMGGGNPAILEILHNERLAPKHFIAHDLDSDNLALLQAGQISFVLHHDLELDMRHAFQALSARHGLSKPAKGFMLSAVQIMTPYNLPAAMAL